MGGRLSGVGDYGAAGVKVGFVVMVSIVDSFLFLLLLLLLLLLPLVACGLFVMHCMRVLTNGTWHIYVDTEDELGDGIDGFLVLVSFFPLIRYRYG